MRSLKICALSALSLAPLAASAATPEIDDIDTRLHAADAVIEGRVESVRFVESRPDSADERGVPHTFVTYRVERVFKGRVRGETVTLRFFGGMDSTGDRLTLPSDGVMHDVGDRDILLVRGNGELECPLVGCAYGRFRLIDDAVYDENGRDMLLLDRETLRRGAVRDLPEVFDWAATGIGIAFDERPPAPERGTAASADAFRGFVADRLALLQQAGDVFPIVVSADPDAPFAYRDAPVAPPVEEPEVDPTGAPVLRR